jgi:hypothetical protein
MAAMASDHPAGAGTAAGRRLADQARRHAQLTAMGPLVGVGFALLSAAALATSVGVFGAAGGAGGPRSWASPAMPPATRSTASAALARGLVGVSVGRGDPLVADAAAVRRCSPLAAPLASAAGHGYMPANEQERLWE